MLQNAPQVAVAYGKMKARLDNMCRQSKIINDSLPNSPTSDYSVNSVHAGPIQSTDTLDSNANLSAITSPSASFEPTVSKPAASLAALSKTTADTDYDTDGTGTSGCSTHGGY